MTASNKMSCWIQTLQYQTKTDSTEGKWRYRSGTVNSNTVNSKFHYFEVNLTGV